MEIFQPMKKWKKWKLGEEKQWNRDKKWTFVNLLCLTRVSFSDI